MSLLRSAWAELLGLFVDDGRMALLVLIWLAAIGLLRRPLGLSPAWAAVVLCAGLAAILVDSVRRGARPAPPPAPPP